MLESVRLDWTQPGWWQPPNSQGLINLSNNICYDPVVADKTKNWIKEFADYHHRSTYPHEHIVYISLANYHRITTKNLTIGFGVSEILMRIYYNYRNSRFAVLGPDWIPSFQMLEILGIDHEVIDSLDADADVIYLANPHGQNGKAFDKETILALTDRYKLVIVDEAYMDFCDHDWSVLKESIDLDNLIVFKNFSKAVASPGIRFSYCVASDKTTAWLQEHRPEWVMNDLTSYLVPRLLPEIQPHVIRMKETRRYIENKYVTAIPSHINSAIFKELPDFKCMMKYTAGNYRMALTDLETFLDISDARS